MTGVKPSTQQPRGVSSGGELWVEKHKPKHSRELVGNNTLIATLRQWLETWCASPVHSVQMELPRRPLPGAHDHFAANAELWEWH